MRNMILASLILLLPIGCTTGSWQTSMGQEGEYGTYPTNYQTIAKHWYTQHLKDPDTAKFLEITLPKEDSMEVDPFKKTVAYGYSVCAKVKAKNESGRHYAKQKLLIREGKVVQYQSPRPVAGGGYEDPCQFK